MLEWPKVDRNNKLLLNWRLRQRSLNELVNLTLEAHFQITVEHDLIQGLKAVLLHFDIVHPDKAQKSLSKLHEMLWALVVVGGVFEASGTGRDSHGVSALKGLL